MIPVSYSYTMVYEGGSHILSDNLSLCFCPASVSVSVSVSGKGKRSGGGDARPGANPLHKTTNARGVGPEDLSNYHLFCYDSQAGGWWGGWGGVVLFSWDSHLPSEQGGLGSVVGTLPQSHQF